MEVSAGITKVISQRIRGKSLVKNCEEIPVELLKKLLEEFLKNFIQELLMTLLKFLKISQKSEELSVSKSTSSKEFQGESQQAFLKKTLLESH